MIHSCLYFLWKDKDLYINVYLHILTTYQICTVFMFQPTRWENNCLVLCCRVQFSSKTPRDLPWCLALEEFTDCYKSWFLLCQISRGVTQRELLVPETTVSPVRYIWRDTNEVTGTLNPTPSTMNKPFRKSQIIVGHRCNRGVLYRGISLVCLVVEFYIIC